MSKFIKKATALLAECGLTGPAGFVDPAATKLIDGKLSLKFTMDFKDGSPLNTFLCFRTFPDRPATLHELALLRGLQKATATVTYRDGRLDMSIDDAIPTLSTTEAADILQLTDKLVDAIFEVRCVLEGATV